MKKIILSFIFFIFFLLIFTVSYLSFVGYETNKFNSLLENKIVSNLPYTKVNLDKKVLDTDNAFDTTTNRFTVPTGGAGWYMCHFSTGIDDVQDSDYVYARLYLNGSSLNHAIGSGWCSAPNAILQASASHMLHLDDGDYLELFVYHNEGTTEPIEQNRCYFGAFRLNI